MIIEINKDKLLDIIEAALWGRMASDDIRETLREIEDIIAAEAWEVVE